MILINSLFPNSLQKKNNKHPNTYIDLTSSKYIQKTNVLLPLLSVSLTSLRYYYWIYQISYTH